MSLLANHGVIARQATAPTMVELDAVTELAGTSVVFTYGVAPVDGHLMVLLYRSTSGAPSTVPGGLTSLHSTDNNGLGIYVYTKIASSETNSYTFGDASSNEKSVIGVTLGGVTTGASVILTADSGATNTTFVDMPAVGGQLYAAGTFIICPLVLLVNKSISRTPFDLALGASTNGTAGTFRTYMAFRSLSTASYHQINMNWPSGTRYKSLTIAVT